MNSIRSKDILTVRDFLGLLTPLSTDCYQTLFPAPQRKTGKSGLATRDYLALATRDQGSRHMHGESSVLITTHLVLALLRFARSFAILLVHVIGCLPMRL